MPGDIATRTVEHDGIRYRIDIDTTTAPTDFDCYGTHDVAAFHSGAWCYVTVTVTLDCDHLDISERVTGVECGSLDGVEVTIDHLIDDHPVTQMMRSCQATLRRLRQQLDVPAAPPDTPTLALTCAEARSMLNALEIAKRHWDDAATIAETAAGHPDRPQPASTPGTANIEPTPAGYAGIAVIAHAEGDTYRRLAIRLRPLIDAADIQ